MNSKSIRRLNIFTVFLWLMLVMDPCRAAAQERVHTVFFEGTDHELNVYRIYGQ